MWLGMIFCFESVHEMEWKEVNNLFFSKKAKGNTMESRKVVVWAKRLTMAQFLLDFEEKLVCLSKWKAWKYKVSSLQRSTKVYMSIKSTKVDTKVHEYFEMRYIGRFFWRRKLLYLVCDLWRAYIKRLTMLLFVSPLTSASLHLFPSHSNGQTRNPQDPFLPKSPHEMH